MRDLRRIHCSYHKCLTVYFKRVLHGLLDRCLPWSGGYHHYNSQLEDFYAGFHRHRLASVNNHALDLERLGSFRISRFIRDPRDLVVSGYFYHRRGAEAWTRIETPSDEDWAFANGVVPDGVRESGSSFAGYLESVSQEEGLLTELQFRQLHFESMAAWPRHHPEILTFRYEEILGNEVRVFAELFRFHRFSGLERLLGRWLAGRYSLRRMRGDAHVRDPAGGQWRRYFTPRVSRIFHRRWGGLLERLGYPRD